MSKKTEQKRPARLSKEARTDSILAAAREVFEEYGYENAKVTEIADRVGVVEGTVFHYFGTKKRLVVKIIEEFYERITREIQEGLQCIEGTRNRLQYLIHFHLNVVTNEDRLCRVILRESRGLDKDLSVDIQRLNRAYTHPLVEILREGISEGELNPDTSIAIVRNAIYGGIEHALWNLETEAASIDVGIEAKQLTDIIYRGISFQEAPADGEVSILIKQLNRLMESQH